MTAPASPGGLDILLIFEDLSDLPRLEQCVFSLVGAASDARGVLTERLAPLRIHLCLPRFSAAEMQLVRSASQTVQELSQETAVLLHDWYLREPHDLRIPLLNLGLEQVLGRYLSCVEIGQLMHPGAYCRLHDRLVETGLALAVGGVEVVPVAWWGDVVVPTQRRHATGPDTPDVEPMAAAFLLDRQRMPHSELRLRAAWSRTPLRDLVAKMSADHPTDRALADVSLAIQQVLVAET